MPAGRYRIKSTIRERRRGRQRPGNFAPACRSGLRCAFLQSVERTLDAPAQLVETLAEAERLFPVAAIWNDRLGSALIQFGAQLGAVVGLVAEHVCRWFHSANKALRDRAIVCFTSGQ